MRHLKILLIGQPNVGKSSLLNALVGPRVVVSNYPGTTVELTQAEKTFNGVRIKFIDTPGIYSISDRSEEEKVTEKALLEEKLDGAIVIADSTSLERSLYMVLQVTESEIPIIVALNFIEEAKSKGIIINSEKLQSLLNVPVVPINPITKKGINNLMVSLLKINEKGEAFRVEYDDHIEKAIKIISLHIKEIALPNRFIAIRVLEGDEDFYKYLEYKKIIERAKKDLKDHPKIAQDISITRYGTASFIAEKVTKIVCLESKNDFSDKIDAVLMHGIWGPFITGLFLFAILGILLPFGNFIQGFLMDLTETFLFSLGLIEKQSIITSILFEGLKGLTAGVSIALPYVFLFYLILGLLEDIGLLSRFVVIVEKFLRKLGLAGKSFIPLALGLGCSIPAIRATRVLSSKKNQFNVASLFAFVPCSSRIAIIMGVVGFYGGAKLAFSVFATSLIAGLIWAIGAKKVIHIKTEPLLIELPPYRKPLIKNVLVKSWIRMKDFVIIVMPLLMLGGIAYKVLDIFDIINIIVKPFSIVTGWLGLPKATIIPLVFGFLQKDLTGAMLISVLGNDISSALTPLQIYTFGVASTIGIPCVIALGMLIREFGFKKAVALTIISIIYGILFAGLIWRIILIF